MDRQLRVAEGEAVLVDRRRGSRVAVALDPGTVQELARLVRELPDSPAVGQTRCRDCFNYVLEVQRPGAAVSAKGDDLSLQGSGLEPLIRRLRQLMARLGDEPR